MMGCRLHCRALLNEVLSITAQESFVGYANMPPLHSSMKS